MTSIPSYTGTECRNDDAREAYAILGATHHTYDAATTIICYMYVSGDAFSDCAPE